MIWFHGLTMICLSWHCFGLGFNGSSCLQLTGVLHRSNIYRSIVTVPLLSIPYITYIPTIIHTSKRRAVNNSARVRMLGKSSDPICVKICVALQDNSDMAVLLTFRQSTKTTSSASNTASPQTTGTVYTLNNAIPMISGTGIRSSDVSSVELAKHQIILLPPTRSTSDYNISSPASVNVPSIRVENASYVRSNPAGKKKSKASTSSKSNPYSYNGACYNYLAQESSTWASSFDINTVRPPNMDSTKDPIRSLVDVSGKSCYRFLPSYFNHGSYSDTSITTGNHLFLLT